MVLSDIRDAVSSAVSSLLSFGLGKRIIQWLADVPEEGDPRALEVKRQGSNEPLPVIYGERLAGPVEVHKFSTTEIEQLTGIESVESDNAYLHIIAAFCHGEIESFEEFFFNGISENDDQFTDNYYIATRTGTGDQDAIPEAVLNIPNWSSEMRGRDVAYAYIVLYQNSDQDNWRGEPEIQARIKGRKIYDPRTETTQYSDNPVLAALDMLTNRVYGRGLELSGIDVQSFITAADFCDEGTSSTVTRTACEDSGEPGAPPICTTEVITVNEPRYRIAAVIPTDGQVFDRYRKLIQVFRGYPRRPNGLPSVGFEDAVSPVKLFDEGELHGSIEFTKPGVKERYNRFTVRFPNRQNNFERDEFTFPRPDNPLYQQWLDEDSGKELVGEIELNTIADTTCAAQNAEIAAKASRVNGQLRINLPPRARLLEPGDIIGINSDRYGWTEKPFRIKRIQEQDDGTFRTECIEHEDAVYPWAGAEWDEQVGGTWLGNPANPPAPEGLQIIPDGTLSTAGTLTWERVVDSFVREYDVRILDDNGDRVKDDTTRGTRYEIPVLDVGDYAIEVRSITTLGILSQPASILLELVEPAAPVSLGLTASNNAITSEPELPGAGLGTSFEFDIDDLEDSGFQPEPRLRGGSATFTGRLPGREYRVWARTVNALGVSGWVSDTIETTTDTAEQRLIVEQLISDPSITEPVFEEVGERIEESQQRVADARVNLVEEAGSILRIGRERRERKTGVRQIEQVIDEESEKLSSLTTEVQAVGDETASISTLIQQAELQPDGSTATTNILASTIESLQGEVDANAQLIVSAQQDIDGNTDSIVALESLVYDEETGLSAIADLIVASGLDEDGNTSVTVALESRLETAEGDIAANAGLIVDVQQDVDDNTSSLASLTARVEGVESEQGDFAEALLSLEADTDDLKARAVLATEVQQDGAARVTSIVVQDDGVDRVIEFSGDVIRFVREDGTNAVVYDTQLDQFVFDGKLAANMVDAESLQADIVDTEKLTADALYGKRQKIESGGRVYVVDPGDVELPSDIIVWFGDDTVSEQDRTKSTGRWWLADDGSIRQFSRVRRNIGSFNATPGGTTINLSAPSIQGEAEISMASEPFLGDVMSVNEPNNVTVEAELAVNGSPLVSQAVRVEVEINEPGANIWSLTAINGFDLSSLVDNSSLDYDDNVDYSVTIEIIGDNVGGAHMIGRSRLVVDERAED